jgi:hypothetical protein
MSANIFKRKTPLLYYFKILANSFAYLNSAINPILYAFLNRSFRNNCGSLFSKPACSLFCSEDYHQPYQQSQKRLPSTQIDRFSYQSTNCQSPPSTQDRKKKIQTTMNYKNHLSTEIISHNEFSDVDYDLSDIECLNRISSEKKTVQKNGSNILTTSL